MSTPFDHIPSCSRTADYTKPTATAPMNTTWKEKVDAAYDMVHALCQPRGSEGSRQWIMSIPARPDYDPDLVITSGLRAAAKEIDRLAAEVDSRDEVITKLLAAQRDEVITKLLDLTAPHVDEFGNRQWWQYKRPEQMHARACEIAGRTE